MSIPLQGISAQGRRQTSSDKYVKRICLAEEGKFLKRHDHQLVPIQLFVDGIQLVLALGDERHGYRQVFPAAAQCGALRELIRPQMAADNGHYRRSKCL